MPEFAHGDLSLNHILSNLQEINSVADKLLADHFSIQTNQLETLVRIGFITPSPNKPDSSHGALNSALREDPPVLIAIIRELEKTRTQQSLFRAQLENARFVSDALYQQTPEANSSAVSETMYQEKASRS